MENKKLRPGWEDRRKDKTKKELIQELREGKDEELLQEYNEIEQSDKRKKFLAALAVAGAGIGISLAATGAKGKDSEIPETEHQTQIETEAETETETVENEETYDYIKGILQEYNEKNPEIEITMEDVGIVKRNTTQYVFEEDGIYKENYKYTNGNPWIEETKTRDLYTLLDKQNQKIISSIGDINYELTYIEAQEIRDPNNIPYYGDASEMVSIEQDELEEVKEECQHLFEKRVKEIEEAKKRDEGR